MNARSLLDSIEPIFIKGGKLERYYGLYEMVDTFIYTPADVTRGTTHVRDGNDPETHHDLCGYRDILCCINGNV